MIFHEVEKVGGELITESNGDDSEMAEFLSLKEIKEKDLWKIYLEVLEKM